jgi:hypothetical protein
VKGVVRMAVVVRVEVLRADILWLGASLAATD